MLYPFGCAMGSLSFLLAAFRFLRLGRIGEPVVRSFQKEYAMSEKFFSEQPSYSNFGSNIIPIAIKQCQFLYQYYGADTMGYGELLGQIYSGATIPTK